MSSTLRVILTQEDKKSVRRRIDNFRQSYVIDTREMVLEHDYVPDEYVRTSADFIIQQDIEKLLRQAANNKKSRQVIYFHWDICRYLPENIRDFFDKQGCDVEMVLMDAPGELEHLYDLFDTVVRD